MFGECNFYGRIDWSYVFVSEEKNRREKELGKIIVWLLLAHASEFFIFVSSFSWTFSRIQIAVMDILPAAVHILYHQKFINSFRNKWLRAKKWILKSIFSNNFTMLRLTPTVMPYHSPRCGNSKFSTSSTASTVTVLVTPLRNEVIS